MTAQKIMPDVEFNANGSVVYRHPYTKAIVNIFTPIRGDDQDVKCRNAIGIGHMQLQAAKKISTGTFQELEEDILRL